LQSKNFRIRKGKNFSIEKTITCGQTFRYDLNNGDYIYPYKKSLLEISDGGDESISVSVIGEDANIKQIKELLGLNDNIEEINKEILEKAPKLSHLIEVGKGLRIMRNPPYEMAISFIFSIQTSIPTIRKRLNLLSEMAGEGIEYKGKVYHTFPTSSALRKLSQTDLASLHIGFRERFLKEFIERYDEEFFEQLSKQDFNKKREALLEIKGIGEKVAQCVLLFGFGELSAFPVDVWIERAMKEVFGISGSTKKITEAGRQIFGNFAGYAQQYMYYFIRAFGHC
jgi:N-glycosylase/DNA lyase